MGRWRRRTVCPRKSKKCACVYFSAARPTRPARGLAARRVRGDRRRPPAAGCHSDSESGATRPTPSHVQSAVRTRDDPTHTLSCQDAPQRARPPLLALPHFSAQAEGFLAHSCQAGSAEGGVFRIHARLRIDRHFRAQIHETRPRRRPSSCCRSMPSTARACSAM